MSSTDLSRALWRKSTRSTTNGNCVEVASNLPGIVAIRDSKDPTGPAFVFTPEAFTVFTTAVRTGQFDH